MNFILPKLNVSIERWKFNPEYNLYVSNMGNVRNKNKQPIKLKVNSSGYMMTSSRVSVHRLVMQTWKPIENNKNMTVDHLNHNKRDNRLTNLEWVTKVENQRRATEDFIQLSEHIDYKSFYTAKITMSSEAWNGETKEFSCPVEAADFVNIICYNHKATMSKHKIANRIIKAAIQQKKAYGYEWKIQKEGE